MRYEIVLTGSNARMLSSELTTLLTGRYVEIEMFPLSFSEYMRFNSEDNKRQEKLFDDYLRYGGFSITAILAKHEMKVNMLMSILDSILFNDVSHGSDRKETTRYLQGLLHS